MTDAQVGQTPAVPLRAIRGETDRRGGASLTAEEFALLTALDNAAPQTMKMADLEADVDLSRQTIGPCLCRLRQLGLVSRPRGERKGHAITAEGVAVLRDRPSRRNLGAN
jgi:DNA-binding MarR family transcriptional regulator